MDDFTTRIISAFASLQGRGSLSETLDHIIIAKDEEMLTEDAFNAFYTEYELCLKLLNGYIQFIKRRKNDELGGQLYG